MRWSLPERPVSFALTVRSHILLMGLASRLPQFDLNTGFVTTVAASSADTGTHIGDGVAVILSLGQWMTVLL